MKKAVAICLPLLIVSLLGCRSLSQSSTAKADSNQTESTTKQNDTANLKLSTVKKTKENVQKSKDHPETSSKYKLLNKAETNPTTTPTDEMLEVSFQIAHFRKGPGTDYEIIGTLHKGARVNAVGLMKDGETTWYLVTYSKKIIGWVSDKVVTSAKDEEKVKNLAKRNEKRINMNTQAIQAPLISQMPELARGCEVTALAMMLQFDGIEVDKMTLAKQIKKVPFLKDGLKGNPNDGFVGDIYTFDKPGLGVFHGPIVALAKKYLGDRVVDITGKGWETVEKYLDKGHPVWVVVTSQFKAIADSNWEEWHTKDGDIKITYREHAVLVTGSTDDDVYFNDPLSDIKNRRWDKEEFVAGWKQFGEQAVSYN